MPTRPAWAVARCALLTVTFAGLVLGFTLPAGASARPHRAPGVARTRPALTRLLARSPLLTRVLGHGGRVTPAAVSNELSFNGSETVTSSTGVTLNLNIGAQEDLASGSTQPVSFQVDLASQSSTDTDSHEWQFQLTRSSLSFNSGTGAISLSSGKQINPFGKATLTFAPSSNGSEPCAVSGTTTFYQGDTNGVFTFDTGSKKWGTVGSSSFTFEESSAEYDKACNQGGGSSTPGCFKSVSWEVVVSDTATNTTLLEGGSGDSPNVSMVRAIALSAPSGADRLDVVIAPAPAPVLTVLSPGAKMAISTTPGDKVSKGSASATSSSSPTVTTSTCLNSANKKKTETQDDWAAKVASDAGHTLVIKTAVGGNVKLKGSPGSSGDIFRNSFA